MTQSSRDRPLGETGGTAQRPARRLAAAALDFDLATELTSLRQEPAWQRGDRNARTLVEEPGVRIVLTVMKANTRLAEHHIAGRVSIHTLSGHLHIHTGARIVDLPPGHLLALGWDVSHDLEALEESAFLLTVTAGEHPSGT